MGFETLHKTVSYLLVLCGLIAVGASGELMVWIPWAAGGAVVVSWFVRTVATEETPWWWTALLMAALVGFFILAIWSGEWLIHTVHFAVVMAAAKLFQRQTARDHFQLYTLSFLLVVGGAVLNPEISFAIMFVAYVVVLTWAMVLLHLRRDFEDREGAVRALRGGTAAEDSSDPALLWRTRRLLRPSFLAGTSILALCVFAASVAIFFLFPRFGWGFFGARSRPGPTVAGFSSVVELGHWGTIKDAQPVVARVELPEHDGPLDLPLRLRGLSFDSYDGRQWTRETRFVRRDELQLSRDGSRAALHNEPSPPGFEILEQRVYLEPLNADVHAIFGAPRIRSISLDESLLKRLSEHKRPTRLKQGRWSGDITFSGATDASLFYTVHSEILRRIPQGVATAGSEYARSITDLYLQLPELSAEVKTLVRTITAGATTPWQKVQAVERFLADGFEYSLEGGHDPADPLADFLLRRRAGHCEYFASGMVILLREAGVPARMANGFYGGVWNDFGNYYEVRQGDAHAWVEVHFPGMGWLTFDPTPASGMLAPVQEGLLERLRRGYDAAKLQWYKWVVEYDLGKQIDLFRELGRRISSLSSDSESTFPSGDGIEGLRQWSRDVFSRETLVQVVKWLFGIWILVWGGRRGLHWWRHGRRVGLSRDVRRVNAAHLRLRSRARKEGIDTPPSMTSEELLIQLARAGFSAQSAAETLVEHYQSVRFGGRALDSRRSEELERAVREMDRGRCERRRAA